MAWIEVHQSLRDHRKLIALGVELGVDDTQAIGHLINLWLWSIDNAPSGSLAALPAAVVAIGARWKGDPERFMDGCKAAGFIDSNGDIHDWRDYAGKLIEQREKKRVEMAERRARGKVEGVTERSGNVPVTSKNGAGMLPSTVPNPTVPNTTNKNDRQNADDVIDPGFLDFWQNYPHKLNRKAAYKAWRALKPDAVLQARMIAAIRQQTAAKFGEMVGTERQQYIPHGSSWINGRQWENAIEPVRPVYGINSPRSGKVAL